MASQEDTDDLYADLYGGGGGEGNVVDLGTNEDAGENNEQDLSGYDEVHKKETNNNVDSIENKLDDSKASAAPSGGSFIPPPSSAQFHQAETGLQIKGSFIPPPAASNQAHSQSDVRDLTPASHNDASSQPQSGSYEAQGESNGQDGGADAGGSENRSIMPHEMPEEGKMFVGGLNWDTTEDSLRRYFSQFGEVGHCTIMRDNLTGRSRGFAFLNFVDPKAVNTVMVREHYLDGKVIDPKRAIPRPQHSHHQGGGGAQSNNYNSGGGGGSHSGQSQKLFVGGLPPSVTPASFRNFFEQYGTLSECTCMTDRETGKPRGFGFLTYADDASLERVLSTRPIVFDGKEVDVKRAQSKNDPQSLQMRRQQRTDQPGIGMQQGGGRYGMGTGSNNFNVGGNTGWGGMNPMMGMGMGAQGFDPSAMAQMYQNMGWGGAQGWNPQMNMAWQQMMASMGGAAAGGAGMDMSAMMNMAGMSNMGNMGMMGAGMGSMSPPMRAGSSMSPTMGSAATAMPKGPSADGGSDRGGSRYQRGGSHTAGGGRPGPGSGSRDERERSPRSGSASNCGRERSPNRAGGNGRYDNGNRDNRY